MYPIERADYINAYIGALSEEMRHVRRGGHAATTRFGSLDRLYGTVAGLLKRGATGTRQTTNPLPSS
ncbi:MAG: hypothetical protein ABFS21_01460 [Actinomycetota bacterium]